MPNFNNILQERGSLECKLIETPIKANHKLGDIKEKLIVDQGNYQMMAVKLIYLSHTKLNIPYAISVVSQFMHSSLKSHLEVVHRIFKYLKSSLSKGICTRIEDIFS